MFEYDIELISNAVTNISESLKKLEGKKANINNILNFGYKSYKNKESLEKVCEDLLEVIKEISDLKSDSEIMKKRITNIDLGDNIELESSVFSSDVVGTLKIGENLNVKDLNQDKYEVLGFDETIKSILNSQEFSEEEKEQFKNNYEKENYSALTFLMKIHNLNQELEVIEDEINKLTEEEYSKKEELNASKISKQQELYDTKKLLELAEFEYLDYLMESEDFIKLSNIESTASLAFAFLKKQDFSFSGINVPIEDIFMYLSLYVTNLRGDNGEYGLADRLYLEQIIKYLCKDEEFKEYLISVGVSSSIVSKEESLFASLIQYQQQGVSYAYTMMTEDEKSKLNYLYQTDFKEADKYVLALEDTLNSRYGYELAMRDVEAILKGETSVEEVFTSFGTGIIPGVRNFSDNTKAWLTGDDTKTYTDYQIEYVSQIISKIYYANGESLKRN